MTARRLNDLVARRIRELRLERGWSQLEMSERYGTSKNSIFRWETGESPLTLHHVEGLTRLFGYTALISFADPDSVPYPELAAVYGVLSPEDQQTILNLARRLAGVG